MSSHPEITTVYTPVQVATILAHEALRTAGLSEQDRWQASVTFSCGAEGLTQARALIQRLP